MDSTIYLATIFIFGLEFTLLILTVNSVIFGLYKRNIALWKHVFNLSIYSAMITSSYYIFTFTGGEVGFFSVSDLGSYFSALVCYYFINVMFIGFYYYLAASVSLLSTFTEFRESLPNYMVTLALAPILMILLESYPITGLILFTFVIVLLSVAFRKYHLLYMEVSNDKTYREQILNSLPVGIITVNDITSENYLNTSASRLLNLTHNKVKELLESQNLPMSNQHFWELISSGKNIQNIKATFQLPNREHHLLVSKSELIDQNNNHVGRIHYFMDITEVEELEKRIHQSEKLALLGEISARAAHEIRNPLTVIYGFLTLMKESFTEAEREKFHIPLLLKEFDRINSIIEEMLLIAKPSAPLLTKSYLEDIIKGILPLYNQHDEKQKLEFNVNLHRVPLLLDPKQMTQVMYNLIRNSSEAIGGKGTISIYSKLLPESYQLFIRDTGFGIPIDLQKTIFEPFLTSKESGTGLGLTIVHRIVENHYGTIELFSSTENGTTFLIILPL
ncbi:two-component system sensor histidine kinase NtrB [Bacillus sp. DJP31]|uniref:two-component system sensor histidine kinase NtrB n=1 Tax=Bacillus sp. DJP31 TaxID=3409789 RepID=UPI003BB7B7C2